MARTTGVPTNQSSVALDAADAGEFVTQRRKAWKTPYVILGTLAADTEGSLAGTVDGGIQS